MAHSEISQDKANLISTLSRYDISVEGDEVLADIVRTDLNFNSFYVNVLVDLICRILLRDNQKREYLYKKLINSLRITQTEFNADILANIRIAAVSHFGNALKKLFEEIRPNLVVENRINSVIEECEKELEQYSHRYERDFQELYEIGKGGFGTVFKVFNELDHNYYAIKKILVSYRKDSDIPKVLREVRRFSALGHTNIVRYNQAWFENPSQEEKKKYKSNSKESSFSSNTHSEINSVSTIGSVKIDAVTSSTNSDDSIIFSESVAGGDFSNYSVHSFKKCSTSKLSISSQNQDSSGSSDFSNGNFSNGDFNNYSRHSLKKKSSKSKCSISCQNQDSGGSSTIVSKLRSSDLSMNKFNRRKFIWKTNIHLTLYIQMEYCDNDLREYLNLRGEGEQLPFKLTEIQIFEDIVNGLDHIHSKSVIHRDLKPNNIFYSSKFNCMKIGDFGLATLSNSSCDGIESTTVLNTEIESHTAACGTPPYAAPEQREQNNYDYKVDMYSLGVILFELLFHVKTRMEFYKGLHEISVGDVPDELKQNYPDYVHLIQSLLSNNPKDRPSIKILLSKRSTLEVKNLKKIVTEKDAVIARKNAIIAGKDAVIARKNAMIAGKDAMIAEKDEEIVKLTKSVKQLEGILNANIGKNKKSKRK